jgi:hypothetical protein
VVLDNCNKFFEINFRMRSISWVGGSFGGVWSCARGGEER